MCGSPHPRGNCPINDYSQQYLAVQIPRSRLNARNAPGTRPLCNCQPLNFADQMKPRTFFMQIIFNMKISRSMVLRHVILPLGKGCNSSLISTNFSKSHFHSRLNMPRSSVIDHTYTMCLMWVKLTLHMHTLVNASTDQPHCGLLSILCMLYWK